MIWMTSVSVMLLIAAASIGIFAWRLEKENDEWRHSLAVANGIIGRWRNYFTIHKGVMEKHYAYLQHAGLQEAFNLWAKEKMEPDPELVHKISQALGERDEVIVEEATVEIVPDDKVEIIALPKLLPVPMRVDS